jgi:hypothetical protein
MKERHTDMIGLATEEVIGAVTTNGSLLRIP